MMPKTLREVYIYVSIHDIFEVYIYIYHIRVTYTYTIYIYIFFIYIYIYIIQHRHFDIEPPGVLRILGARSGPTCRPGDLGPLGEPVVGHFACAVAKVPQSRLGWLQLGAQWCQRSPQNRQMVPIGSKSGPRDYPRLNFLDILSLLNTRYKKERRGSLATPKKPVYNQRFLLSPEPFF